MKVTFPPIAILKKGGSLWIVLPVGVQIQMP